MKKKLLARFALCNPRRLWKQDNFVLSTFSPGLLKLDDESEESNEIMRRSVRTCYNAGFNLLELGWASHDRAKAAVQMCEQLGIGVIYQNLKRYGGMGSKNIFCKTNDLLGSMEEMRRWKSVVGYYVWDEPVTEEQMHVTRNMIDTVERERPESLPFTVANPSYNRHFLWADGNYSKYIDQYIDIIDPPIMSFDYYPVGAKTNEHDEIRQLDESLMWCDLEYVRRAAKKANIPFWFYYQGQNLHGYPHFVFPMVRVMMHGALLYGVKGLQHYTAWESVVDAKDGGKGEYFEDQKQIHFELSQLGRTLMALDCTHVIHDASLLPNCPYMKELKTDITDSKLLDGELPYRTSVSELTDAYGNDYLMVLNRDYVKDADITLKLKTPSRVYEVSREDGEQRVLYDNVSELNISLINGGLGLYRIENADKEPSIIEYYLEKEYVPTTEKAPKASRAN